MGGGGPAAESPAAKELPASKKRRLDSNARLAWDIDDVENLDGDGVQVWVEAALHGGKLKGTIKDETSDVGKVAAILKKEMVTGAALVKLTVDELVKTGIAWGPSKILAERIAGLRAAMPPAPRAPRAPHAPRAPRARARPARPARRVNTGLTKFFQLLKNVEPDKDNILSLKGVSDEALRTLHVLKPHGVLDVRFLLREEYVRLYDDLQITSLSAAVVVGTAGIGKSALRFYIMRRWMRNDLGETFPKVIFNLGDTFYELDREGNARRLPTVLSLGDYDSQALALFDPCPLVSGLSKNLHFKYMLVTTSPSPLSGQPDKGSLTELTKCQVSVHVMKGWTREEVRLVHPAVGDEMLEAFGYVPRWCMYRSVCDPDLEEKLFENFSRKKLKALYNFMKSTVTDAEPMKDEELPYRVMRIERKLRQGWGATGFISRHVAGLFAKKAYRIADGKTADFVHMMRNPFGKQALGPLFEEWAFGKMALQVRLNLEDVEPPPGVFNKAGTFEKVDVSSQEKASTKMDLGTIYRAPVGYPSIDMYGIVESTDGKATQLLLLQDTVGKMHRPGQWKDVCNVVKAARAKVAVARVTLVYLVPKGDDFTVPQCPTLTPETLEVTKGSLDEDFEVDLKVWGADS